MLGCMACPVGAWWLVCCDGYGGGCVEAGVAERGLILVRDTTNRGGALLVTSAVAWQSFTSSLK